MRRRLLVVDALDSLTSDRVNAGAWRGLSSGHRRMYVHDDVRGYEPTAIQISSSSAVGRNAISSPGGLLRCVRYQQRTALNVAVIPLSARQVRGCSRMLCPVRFAPDARIRAALVDVRRWDDVGRRYDHRGRRCRRFL